MVYHRGPDGHGYRLRRRGFLLDQEAEAILGDWTEVLEGRLHPSNLVWGHARVRHGVLAGLAMTAGVVGTAYVTVRAAAGPGA